MISNKTLKALEFDKIMAEVSSYAVLERTKELVISFLPLNDINAVRTLLSKTCEAFKLLFTYSTGNIVYFDDITDQINFANKGGTLSCADLLKVAQNLKSARIINKAIASVNDKDIVSVEVESEGRKLIFGDVVVRVSEKFSLAMHIDTDEGNAANVGNGDGTKIRIVK